MSAATRKKLRGLLVSELQSKLVLVDPNGGGSLVPSVLSNHPDPVPEDETPVVNVTTLRENVEPWSSSTPSLKRTVEVDIEVVVTARAALEDLSDTIDDALTKVETIVLGATGLGLRATDPDLSDVDDPMFVRTEIVFLRDGRRLEGAAMLSFRYAYFDEPKRDGGDEHDLATVHSDLTIGEAQEDFPAKEDSVAIEQE